MNELNIENKLKKDLLTIENKLICHKVFLELSTPETIENVDDLRSMTRTYFDIIRKLFDRNAFESTEDVYNYFIKRVEVTNKIYDKITIKSEYYLNEEENKYYKKIMDAFDNIIEVYHEYDSTAKSIRKKLDKEKLDVQIEKFVDDIEKITVKKSFGSYIKIRETVTKGNYFRENGHKLEYRVDDTIEDNYEIKFKDKFYSTIGLEPIVFTNFPENEISEEVETFHFNLYKNDKLIKTWDKKISNMNAISIYANTYVSLLKGVFRTKLADKIVGNLDRVVQTDRFGNYLKSGYVLSWEKLFN